MNSRIRRVYGGYPLSLATTPVDRYIWYRAASRTPTHRPVLRAHYAKLARNEYDENIRNDDGQRGALTAWRRRYARSNKMKLRGSPAYKASIWNKWNTSTDLDDKSYGLGYNEHALINDDVDAMYKFNTAYEKTYGDISPQDAERYRKDQSRDKLYRRIINDAVDMLYDKAAIDRTASRTRWLKAMLESSPITLRHFMMKNDFTRDQVNRAVDILTNAPTTRGLIMDPIPGTRTKMIPPYIQGSSRYGLPPPPEIITIPQTMDGPSQAILIPSSAPSPDIVTGPPPQKQQSISLDPGTGTFMH